jgi:hypothetical protein
MRFIDQKRLWLAAAIIGLVVVLGFALSVPHTQDLPLAEEETAALPPVVAIKDSIKKDVHTITGTVEAPNACARVGASASLAGESTSTRKIVVAVLVESEPGVCLELPTRFDFKTTVTAPALPLEVTVNGELATTTP